MNKVLCFSLLFAGGLATAVWGGGFWLEAQTPDSPSSEGTVASVFPIGCHEPAQATFSATAEGLINGHRKTVRLKEVRGQDGEFEIQRQWPTEGRWVLAVTASYRGQTRSVLIQVDPETGNPVLANQEQRKLRRSLTESDILAALQSPVGPTD